MKKRPKFLKILKKYLQIMVKQINKIKIITTIEKVIKFKLLLTF
jgi:hypothetical protein